MIETSRLTTLLLIDLVGMVFLPCRAFAQVNIENLRQRSDESGFSTTAKIDLTSRTGNVDLTELEIDVRNEYAGSTSATLLLLRSDLGWEDGRRFSNAGLAHVRYVHAGAHVEPEVFVQGDYDRSRKLERRGLIGGGLRLELLQRNGFSLAWGTAYMLEHERYDLPPEAAHARVARAHRWSNYLAVFASIGDNVTVAWTAYVQPRLDDFDDVRLLNDMSVGVKVSDALLVNTTFRARYDGRPPDDIEDLDTRLATGITITF